MKDAAICPPPPPPPKNNFKAKKYLWKLCFSIRIWIRFRLINFSWYTMTILLKGIYVQWYFLLLQGTTCSSVLVPHQILLRGQTLWLRNMPKGCGNKMPLYNFPDSLAFAFRWQLNIQDLHVRHDLIGMCNPSLHH